jgi:hypothetical protein
MQSHLVLTVHEKHVSFTFSHVGLAPGSPYSGSEPHDGTVVGLHTAINRIYKIAPVNTVETIFSENIGK